MDGNKKFDKRWWKLISINRFSFQLITVSLLHISGTHPLKTKSNVIIHLLSQRKVAITEHLTEDNLAVLYRAKVIFEIDYYCTVKCKIFVTW